MLTQFPKSVPVIPVSNVEKAAEYYHATREPVMVWLNLNSREEVDELYRRCQQAGAKIVSEPGDKPWRLREFRVADLDDNQLRVFYDFSWELAQQHP